MTKAKSSLMTKLVKGRYVAATLYLQMVSETLRIDEETGNAMPVLEPKEFHAVVKQNNQMQQQLPGLDVSEIAVSGYLTDPMLLPDGLRFPLECDAEVGGRRGRLRIPFLISTALDKKTGQKFQGIFKAIA